MKRLLFKRLVSLLLIALAAIILTSCIEMVQTISHSGGKFHYESIFSLDKEKIASLYDAFGKDITAEEMEEMSSSADSMIEDLSSFLDELKEEFAEISTTITKVNDYTVEMKISFPEYPRDTRLRNATLPINPLRTLIPLYPLMQEEKEEETDTTNSQEDDLAQALDKMIFYDSYCTILIQDKLLPDDILGVELCNMDLEGRSIDYKYTLGFLIVKIPMAEFIDGTNYTHLYIY